MLCADVSHAQLLVHNRQTRVYTQHGWAYMQACQGLTTHTATHKGTPRTARCQQKERSLKQDLSSKTDGLCHILGSVLLRLVSRQAVHHNCSMPVDVLYDAALHPPAVHPWPGILQCTMTGLQYSVQHPLSCPALPSARSHGQTESMQHLRLWMPQSYRP